MKAFTELALAKVNLYLHVTARRADGYHLLESLVAFTDIADRIEAEAAETISLSVTGNSAMLQNPRDNIILKGARLLKEMTGFKGGAQLRLHKHLPVAAGIGGGSADAAATIRLLTRMWCITLPAAELAGLAAMLGADVAACLRSESLYMRGIGEVIEPGPDLSGLYIVLVNPGMPLLTRDVFEAYRGPFSTENTVRPVSFATQDALLSFLHDSRNDLEVAAIEKASIIKDVLEVLQQQPDNLLSRMSGSGATCFGLFAAKQSATYAATAIQKAHPEWWVKQGTLT